MATQASSGPPAPASAAPAAAPAARPKGRPGKPRGPLRADSGDVCAESHSPRISLRREAAQQALRKHQAAGRVSDRVVAALLKSELTLQLLDLLRLVEIEYQTALL